VADMNFDNEQVNHPPMDPIRAAAILRAVLSRKHSNGRIDVRRFSAHPSDRTQNAKDVARAGIWVAWVVPARGSEQGRRVMSVAIRPARAKSCCRPKLVAAGSGCMRKDWPELRRELDGLR
jgi:hypothetical protein